MRRAPRTPSITPARAPSAASTRAADPREQRVDEQLWTLYQGIAAGGQSDLQLRRDYRCGFALSSR